MLPERQSQRRLWQRWESSRRGLKHCWRKQRSLICLRNSFQDDFQDHEPLCHKGDFNPSWIVNAVLLLNLSYVTLMCTLRQEPEIFIEVFWRNFAPWWLKIYSFRLIRISQFSCLLCRKTFLCYSYRKHNAILQYNFISAANKRHLGVAEISTILH